jgi:hypothetical protein
MSEVKITAVSKDRYRATAAERRQYGGSTITEFYVTRQDTDETKVFTGYGKTPGERKTYAMQVARGFWGLLLLVVALLTAACGGQSHESTQARDPWEDCQALVPSDVYVQPTPGGMCVFSCDGGMADVCSALDGYCEDGTNLCTGVCLDGESTKPCPRNGSNHDD